MPDTFHGVAAWAAVIDRVNRKNKVNAIVFVFFTFEIPPFELFNHEIIVAIIFLLLASPSLLFQ